MKALVLFSAFLMGFTGVADAAAPVQRRGAGASGAANNVSSSDTGAAPVAARAASRTRVSAPATGGGTSAVSARAAVRSNAPAGNNSGATTSTVSARSASRTNTANTNAGSAKAPTVSARAASTQKVIQSGVKINTATENVVVSTDCRQKYEGCMDSFCMIDNASGGRCMCSDKNEDYSAILAEIEKLDRQSYQMVTLGVERINMGSDADAAIKMANQAAKEVENSIEIKDITTPQKSKGYKAHTSAWTKSLFEDDDDFDIFDLNDSKNDIANLTGDALHKAAADLCVAQMPECKAEINMLQLMYGQKIKGDCAAYENSLKTMRDASAQKLQTAETELRAAALESYRSANAYDLGECTLKFKECMQDKAECGTDFSGCIGMSAMMSLKGESLNQYQISGMAANIGISSYTYSDLAAKSVVCKTILNSCTDVKDQVFDAFLRMIAPQIKSAELIAESNLRNSCLSMITKCINDHCKSSVGSDDAATMAACATDPNIARGACKVQIDQCETAIPGIMNFVDDKLASLRVDECANDMRNCLQSPNRCGPDYSACFNMDLDDLKQMCPVAKLVGCQKADGTSGRIQASYDDAEINSFLRGIFNEIDNKMATQCEKFADNRMIDICGDIDYCELTTAVGASSLDGRHDGNDYIIDGLVDFNAVKIKKTNKKTGDATATNGTTEDVGDALDDYQYNYKFSYTVPATVEAGVKDRIEGMINAMQRELDGKLSMILNDRNVDECVNGRDVRNISLGDKQRSTGRYPSLLLPYEYVIAESILEQARQNYDKKFNELYAAAVANQSSETKAVMCAAMAMNADDTEEVTDKDGNTTTVSAVDQLLSTLDGAGETKSATEIKITGVGMSNMAKSQASGKGEWILTDEESGAQIGSVNKSALFDAAKNECTITTVTKECKNLETLMKTTTTKKRGGLFRKKKKVVSTEYQGVVCKEFSEPQTQTQVIKM